MEGQVAAINDYVGEEFPGAISTVEADLDVAECASFATMQLLALEISDNQSEALTIRHGRVYTDMLKGDITTICVGA